MVFSPLTLFIFLLLILVIIVWFYKYFGENPVFEIQEPLVDFGQSMKAGSTIPFSNELPPYSGNLPNKNIAKIFDNVFYDINNGNLIEVDSKGTGETGTTPTPTVTRTTPTPTVTGNAAPTVTRTTPTPTVTGNAAPTVTVTGTTAPTVTGNAAPMVTGTTAPTVTGNAAPTVTVTTVTGTTPMVTGTTPTVTGTTPTVTGTTVTTKKEGFKDNDKTVIEKIWISRRQDAGTPVVPHSGDSSTITTDSQLEFKNSYNHFVYNTRSKNTDPYSVLYISWLDGTFITMINLKKNELVTTQLFSSKGTTSNTLLYNESSLGALTPTKPITPDNNPDNNKYILLKKYDSRVHVFQLSSNIYFDPRNTQLIVSEPNSNNITVYSRMGRIISNGYLNNTDYEKSSVLNSWTYYDTFGTKLVLYISFDEITLIILIESDPTSGPKGAYRIYNVQRFDKNGVDTGTNTEITKPQAPENKESKATGNNISKTQPTLSFPQNTIDPASMQNSTDMLNDYYKWYYYWVKNGKKDSSSHKHMYSEDYMLKTQIVPPVCPACSTSLGTCVNCSSGNNFTGGDSIFYNPWLNFYSKDKNIPTVTTSRNNEEDCDLCSECSDENPMITTIKPTTTTTPFQPNKKKQKQNVYNTPSNGGDFVGEEGDFVGEEGDFMGEEGDFMGEEGDFMGEEGGFMGEEIPTSNNVMDPYSYFNSVPSKGSDFVPILSDFSKFGR